MSISMPPLPSASSKTLRSSTTSPKIFGPTAVCLAAASFFAADARAGGGVILRHFCFLGLGSSVDFDSAEMSTDCCPRARAAASSRRYLGSSLVPGVF